MKTFCSRIAITFLLFLNVAFVRGGELANATQAYTEKVNSLAQSLPTGTNPLVADYLKTCLANVTRLNGVNDDTPNVSILLKEVADLRNVARQKLVDGTSGAPAVRAETAAYNEHLQSLSADSFLGWVSLQNQFLERKYFNTKTAKTGNFIEGYINGQWKLTSADPKRLRERGPPRPVGVSPWEAIFRLEPTLAMRDGGQAAIMGTGGLSCTFFPRIVGGTPPKLEENFRSEWVKKSGVRAGAGAVRLDGKTRLLLGAGMQLNALGIWGLYEPKRETWMLGLSTADLNKLKKALGWFE